MKFVASETVFGVDKVGFVNHAGSGGGHLFFNGREMALEDGFALQRALEKDFVARGVACTFFDYGGWGKSGADRGRYMLARWIKNAIDVLEATAKDGEKQTLIGYSFGFYMALAVAILRPDLVKGLIGLAPSLAAYLKETERDFVPDVQDEPLFFADLGADNVVKLRERIELGAPIKILHGTADRVANFGNSLKVREMIVGSKVEVELLEGCGHFFKRESDLAAAVGFCGGE